MSTFQLLLSFGFLAKKLDEQELVIRMQQGSDCPELLNFVADGSNNVDDAGNFSISVIMEALDRFGLKCVNIGHESEKEAAADPLSVHAFICNLHSHWFAIRKLHGKFINLNSAVSHPVIISEFFLRSFPLLFCVVH